MRGFLTGRHGIIVRSSSICERVASNYLPDKVVTYGAICTTVVAQLGGHLKAMVADHDVVYFCTHLGRVSVIDTVHTKDDHFALGFIMGG